MLSWCSSGSDEQLGSWKRQLLPSWALRHLERQLAARRRPRVAERPEPLRCPLPLRGVSQSRGAAPRCVGPRLGCPRRGEAVPRGEREAKGTGGQGMSAVQSSRAPVMVTVNNYYITILVSIY